MAEVAKRIRPRVDFPNHAIYLHNCFQSALYAMFFVVAWVCVAETCDAHEGERLFAAEEIRVATPVGEVVGTLLKPCDEAKTTCILICGGSLSHDRDGTFSRPGVSPRDALKRLAQALAAGGYASFRYDPVGHGASKAADGWENTYTQHAQVVAHLVRYLRQSGAFSHVVVAGESAGAYHACLAAKAGTRGDGYIFLGGLCRTGPEMYEYNFGRLVAWAERSPENMKWARRHARRELAIGRYYREWFDAASQGKSAYALVDGDFRATLRSMDRRREELTMPPNKMFSYIQTPVLALAGACDRNVPPSDAAEIVTVIRKAGNPDAVSMLIPNADHSFQQVPADEDAQIRERFDFSSFKRPYQIRVYQEMLAWLRQRFPVALSSKGGPITTAPALSNEVTVEAVTEYTPEKIHLAPGIQIIEDITEDHHTASVDTLEGRIGPLILADNCQTHFIDMPAGMYVEEHPHSSGSIIYTVKGKWVLCSSGRRFLMQPGALFRFEPNTPTGYEIPFDENAYILIFKSARLSKDEKEFINYLKTLSSRLIKRHERGTPFLLKELPADHPARLFGRQVNPMFEADRRSIQVDSARPVTSAPALQ